MVCNMKRALRGILALGAVLAVSACATTPVSRDVSVAPFDGGVQQASVQGLRDFYVAGVNISVPRSLVVSEKNSYYPGGDIVWHGDPMGDRFAQVQAIFDAGIKAGTRGFTGSRAVVIDVQVTRFHSLTPKARYTVGGVHSISFHMRVRDAKTGAVLVPSHLVRADLQAYGGAVAVAAEAHGDTQKVRVTNHLAAVFQQELRKPGSFVPEGTGVMGVLNQM